MATVYAPIYKDTVYTYSGDTLFFRIESPSGNTLLRGEASTRPDGTPAQVYVNRLCEPFLSQEFDPTVSGLTVQSGGSRVFYLVEDDESGQTLESYEFVRMYGYRPCWFVYDYFDWYGNDAILSDPIKPSISRDMVMPFTMYQSRPADAEIATAPTDYYLNFTETAKTISANVASGTSVHFNISSTNIPIWNRRVGVKGSGDASMLIKTIDPEGREPDRPDVDATYLDPVNNRVTFRVLPNTTGKQRTYSAEITLRQILGGPKYLNTITLIQQA